MFCSRFSFFFNVRFVLRMYTHVPAYVCSVIDTYMYTPRDSGLHAQFNVVSITKHKRSSHFS